MSVASVLRLPISEWKGLKEWALVFVPSFSGERH